MLKKIAAQSLTILAIGVGLPAHADNYSCFVELAVAAPPVGPTISVAFNISNDSGVGVGGVNRSYTLSGGSAPKTVEKLPCTDAPYTISATEYSVVFNQLAKFIQVGQCHLKAGPIILGGTNNSVSVVYPHDFDCV